MTTSKSINEKKEELRQYFRERIAEIPFFLRAQSAFHLVLQLYPYLPKKGIVASFSSKGYEIDTRGLNQILGEANRLALPRVEQDFLRFYKVQEPHTQLILSAWGIKEPDPEKCEPCSPDEFSALLVPGLAFDSKGNRLGWGKGLYDRFLSQFPNALKVAIGLALQEQESTELLPTEPHDIALPRQHLF